MLLLGLVCCRHVRMQSQLVMRKPASEALQQIWIRGLGRLCLKPGNRNTARYHHLPRFQAIHTIPERRQYLPHGTQKFEPFLPINPATLPKPPRQPRRPWRPRKTTNTLLILTGLSLVVYLIDKNFNYSALTRSLRTIYTAVLITLDYKLRFTQHKSDRQLSQLHSRNADRIVELCLLNGGLYQKIGQAIAMQSALFPTEFQAKFALFFSDTPQVGRREIEKVLREEFPNLEDPVNELFVPGTFSPRALGSASVAQVHKAQLNDGSGKWVAVKIQKPGISRQVGWDLAVFRLVMGVFSEKIFGLPLSFVTPYICERLESETDFNNERANSTQMRELIEDKLDKGRVPGHARFWLWGGEDGRVYVPEIFQEYSTRRVLVAEWIDGVLLSNGRKGGFAKRDISPKVVMHSLLQLFARQMFWWGHVHCDPHPGNIIVRKVPTSWNSFDGINPSAPRSGESMTTEVVLLDHGLYIYLPPSLRQQYARLWTALMSRDTATVAEIATEWGFGNAEMVASMTMLRPYRGSVGIDLDLVGPGRLGSEETQDGKGEKELTPYERQVRVKEAMKAALSNEEKVPRELVFLGRCMRILQGNNQLVSSPVNRLNLLAISAAASLLPGNPNYSPHQFPSITTKTPPTPAAATITARIHLLLETYIHHIVFRLTLIALDLGFWFTRIRSLVLGSTGLGFEDEIEERMRRVAKEEWGLDIGGGVFQG